MLAAVAHIEGAEAIDPGLRRSSCCTPPACARWARSGAARTRSPTASRSPIPSLARHRPGADPGGRALVRRCAELGIAVDLSHLNEAGFWDVAAARARAADRLALGRPRAVPRQPQPHRRPARRDRRLRRARRHRLRGRASCAPTAPRTPTRRWRRSSPTSATSPTGSASTTSRSARTSTARRSRARSATPPACRGCSTRSAPPASARTRWSGSPGATGGACSRPPGPRCSGGCSDRSLAGAEGLWWRRGCFG